MKPIFFLLFFSSFAYGLEYEWEKVPFEIEKNTSLISAQALKVKSTSTHKQKLPVVFVFGGFEGAKDVLLLFKPQVPVFLVSFDYPFSPPRKFELTSSLKHIPDARKAITQTFKGISILLNKLKKRKDLDLNRISIVGASFGAPFAIDAASKHSEFKALLLLQGFGEIASTLENRMRISWQKHLGPLTPVLCPVLSKIADLILPIKSPNESIKYLRATQKVLIIHAKDDDLIPKAVQESLTQAAQTSGAEVTVKWISGQHLRPDSKEQLNQLVRMSTVYLKEKGLL